MKPFFIQLYSAKYCLGYGFLFNFLKNPLIPPSHSSKKTEVDVIYRGSISCDNSSWKCNQKLYSRYTPSNYARLPLHPFPLRLFHIRHPSHTPLHISKCHISLPLLSTITGKNFHSINFFYSHYAPSLLTLGLFVCCWIFFYSQGA